MDRSTNARLRVRLALFIGVLLIGENVELSAQTIHKCVNPDGLVAYQETPCAAASTARIIEIAPVPVVANEAENPVQPKNAPTRATALRVSTQKPAMVYSFECTTRTGAVFYRHKNCPARIPKSGALRSMSSNARSETESVSAHRLPRAEACRRMRSVGRSGREHDDVTPTYERNLGRDPCRRY